MNGHMRISVSLCLCGWLTLAGVAAQAVGVGREAGAGGAALDKDFEMLFGPEAAKVAATPDGRDDAAFAEKVLAVARPADKSSGPLTETPPLHCSPSGLSRREHDRGLATVGVEDVTAGFIPAGR